MELDSILANAGVLVTFVSLVAYIVRMEAKQKELDTRRKEDNARHSSDLEKHEQLMKLELLNGKNSRKSIRKEVAEADKEVQDQSNKRIDIVKGDLKEFELNTKNEFKEINEKLGAVVLSNGKIEGMLTAIQSTLNGQ
jgi:hypothetical protein